MTSRPEIVIIAAVTSDLALGRGGDLLYHISDDLRRFKVLTLGCPIIMGRKTFESFPKGALPGRRNIVVTRNSDYTAPNIEVTSSLSDAIGLCAESKTPIFIIGGGEIYRQALPLADKLELTVIEADAPDADTFFPDFSEQEWLQTEKTDAMIDPKSGAAYRFITFRRKQ